MKRLLSALMLAAASPLTTAGVINFDGWHHGADQLDGRRGVAHPVPRVRPCGLALLPLVLGRRKRIAAGV